MEAIGPVLIVLSLPLIFGWVPRNRVFGFRVAATLRDDSVWYDANSLFGWHFLLLGVVLVLLELLLPPPASVPLLRSVALLGLLTIVVADWRTANRWERERRRPATT